MIIDKHKLYEIWSECMVRDECKPMLEHMAQRALLYKQNFYDPVEKATNVPWYVVAAIDMREENFNHNGYLGNGDPLWHVTTHIPRGRGPFKTWYDGAIDAFKLDHMSILPVGSSWDILTSLIKCEAYNGLGYASKGLPSPYVWASTNIQVPGKYTSDGHFDPHAMDQQPGCAALFLTLKEKHNVDIKELMG